MTPNAPPEMSLSKRLLLIVALVIVCVGSDQSTKALAKHMLEPSEVVTLMGDSVRVQLARNYGTFLSLGASLSPQVRTMVTTAGVGLILAGLLTYLLIAKPDPIVTSAMALFIGGGLSNLIDRIAYGGYVVDFLNVGIGPVRTGIFNVADMFIMAAVAIILFSDWIHKRVMRTRDAQV